MHFNTNIGPAAQMTDWVTQMPIVQIEHKKELNCFGHDHVATSKIDNYKKALKSFKATSTTMFFLWFWL